MNLTNYDEQRELERATQRNETADVLRRARALIATPEKWWRGGESPTYAACYMIAITRSLPTYHSIWLWTRVMSCALPPIGVDPLTPDAMDAAYKWNDHPSRTHAEVLAAFDLAIALAEQHA